jgi:hypothetical protein
MGGRGRFVEDEGVKLLRRRGTAPRPSGPQPGFGSWLLEQFAAGTPVADLPFARLERACSNVASLVCGAAFVQPGPFRRPEILRPALRDEAGVVSRRTADGFRAALADREHTVLAWPWEHVGTSVAWRATRAGEVEVLALGAHVEQLAGAYAIFCREQLTAVFDLWRGVAAGVYRGELEPDLPQMGCDMLAAFEAGRSSTEG